MYIMPSDLAKLGIQGIRNTRRNLWETGEIFENSVNKNLTSIE